MTNGIIANIIIPINPIILSLIGFIMNTSLLKKGEQRLTNFDLNHKLALNKTFVNTLAPLLCKVWCDLTQKTKMNVFPCTNLSLFLFISLQNIKSPKSKHLKKVTQFTTPPRRYNTILKVKKTTIHSKISHKTQPFRSPDNNNITL